MMEKKYDHLLNKRKQLKSDLAILDLEHVNIPFVNVKEVSEQDFFQIN